MSPTEIKTVLANAPLRLIVVAGKLAGRKFPVEEGAVIGRSVEATLQLADGSVSRRHARVVSDAPGRFWIEDLGSINGTFINDVPIEKAELIVGDRLRVGAGVVLVVTRFEPTESELQQRNRLEMIGRLAAGLVHDIKNTQAVVLGGAGYVLTQPEDTPVGHPDVREALEDTCTAAKETSRLLERVLSLSRTGSDSYQRVDVTALMRRAARLAKHVVQRNVSIDTEIGDALAIVGDETALLHSILNICINAGDAMPAGGMLTLRALGVGGNVTLTFCDTGMGMPERVRARIFEPFFTSKAHRAGFGIGLAVVHSTILAHGGHIEVASETGRGTTFTIHLSALLADGAQLRHTDPAPAHAVRQGKILVADDDDLMRRTWARLLKSARHVVEVAGSGEEALQMFQAWRARDTRGPDLLLLDKHMPGIDGIETARRIRAIDPSIGVILVTGDPVDIPADLPVLVKPVSADDLLAAVDRALNEERPAILDEPTNST